MSHLTTPFIVINLGCEMIYVVEQRLRAQDIPVEKSIKVLTDITAVLLNDKLMDELFIPQPAAGNHNVIKQLLQDITSASIMRLDEYSMDKLWDLMTMIFKWQITTSYESFQTSDFNILDITLRHLDGVARMMPQNYPKHIFQNAARRFRFISNNFNDEEKNSVYNTLISWFSCYHTKISVLLRLGLQKKDGLFTNTNEINSEFADNLGYNIYSYEAKLESCSNNRLNSIDTKEIIFLVAQLKGNDSNETNENVKLELRIPFASGDDTQSNKILSIDRKDEFYNVDTEFLQVKEDIQFKITVPNSAKKDLLDLIESEEFD